MIKFFSTLIVFFTVTICIAQNRDVVNFTPKPEIQKSIVVVSDLSPDMKVQYQLDYVRHCLHKYQAQKKIGYYIGLSGAALSALGAVVEPSEDYYSGNTHFVEDGNKQAMYIAGGALSIIGTVIIIDSEKWLKRAYIGPDGLGVKFTF